MLFLCFPHSPNRQMWIDGLLHYYFDSRLRAAPEERERFCGPMERG